MNPTSRHHITRVVACAGGSETRIEERALRAPARGELLLRVRVVGLCGTDLFKLGEGLAEPGGVLGHELVGEVLECGPEVDAVRPGDRVAVPHHVPCGTCRACAADSETLCETFRENLMEPGGFSDLVLIGERAVREALRAVPDEVADDIAVWLEPAACVLRALRRGGVGDSPVDAAVLGAGSMGALHLLLLKALNPASRVQVIDPREDRRAQALALGADQAFTPVEALDARRARVDGGADAVFDTVGGASVLRDAIALTREGGTVVLFAHAPQGQPADFDINSVFKSERRIIGSYSGTPSEQAAVFELMTNGRFDPSPLVSHRLDLARFDEGVTLARTQVAMKVLFTGAER